MTEWDQLDLFDGAVHARRDDPGTSWAAATSVRTPTIRAVHRAQLELLDAHSDTHDSLWERYEQQRLARDDWPLCSVSGFRTRCSELVDIGLVADSDVRVRLPSGRLSIVWKITPAGRVLLDVYRELSA